MSTDTPLSAGLLASLSASGGLGVLLIRHSDRFPIGNGDLGYSTGLTAEGERRAQRLGEALSRKPDLAVASPLFRCMRTAELVGCVPTPSSVLGDHGPFVVDHEVGGEVWSRLGNEGVVRGQLLGETWGCMRSLAEGAALMDALFDGLLSTPDELSLAVSHDAIVMPYIRHHTGEPFTDDWLAPLDGVVVTRDTVFWRGERHGRVR